jgi:hypothetical protein
MLGQMRLGVELRSGCTYIKTPSSTSWAVGWCFVSKMVRRIRPAAPTIAAMIEQTLRKASHLE